MFDPTAQYLQDAQEERLVEEEDAGDGSGKRRRTDVPGEPPPVAMVMKAPLAKPMPRRAL
jgi:hypothetical protein